LTHLCELQRIVYNYLPGYERTKKIEVVLGRSDTVELQKLVRQLDAAVLDGTFDNYASREALVKHTVASIAKWKNINPALHVRFMTGMKDSILAIWFVRSLGVRLEAMRSAPFVRGDPVHEAMLKELWVNFMGEELEERYSKKWQHIGFQGNDPATDFRGTGLLGLHALIYFSRTYPEIAKKLLLQSQHPTLGYPLACLSLHITFLCYQLLTSGVALTHFYNAIEHEDLHKQKPGVDLELRANAGQTDKLLLMFYDFYSAVLAEFSTFWILSKPNTLMDFGPVKKNFEKKLRTILESKTCVFRFDTRIV
jgi:hypothetical protein